jgi:hypothetical protein
VKGRANGPYEGEFVVTGDIRLGPDIPGQVPALDAKRKTVEGHGADFKVGSGDEFVEGTLRTEGGYGLCYDAPAGDLTSQRAVANSAGPYEAKVSKRVSRTKYVTFEDRGIALLEFVWTENPQEFGEQWWFTCAFRSNTEAFLLAEWRSQPVALPDPFGWLEDPARRYIGR